jgi:uncharacterized protein YndB with AHSA1/START domain
MSRNVRFIEAAPERVFSVLADARCYGDWVVGSREIRDADPAFPAPGARFHHTIGVGPLVVRDHTEVLACEPPRLLRLRARARPFGAAIVTLTLEPRRAGTEVTIVEDPSGWTKPLWLLPSTHVFGRLRNFESLRRLKRLAERRR